MKYTKQSEGEDIAQTFIDKLVQDITWICRNCGKSKMNVTSKLLLLFLSAAPIQGSPQRMFFKHLHRRFGSVLRWMPFLTQPTTDFLHSLTRMPRLKELKNSLKKSNPN